jgi:uncharacterized protein
MTMPNRVFRLAAVLCLLAASAAAFAAQPTFPKLTGRVVDNAGLLSQSVQQQLSRKLAAYARANGTQVVVVTLKSLHGLPIDEYGYQLGRHWGIGQKGKNNGALLIVAPNEKKTHGKVRIEVGYGLEGKLTDALTFNIINQVIVPQFKQGHYAKGIVAGTNDILKALGGKYKPRQAHRRHRNPLGGLLMIVLLGCGFLPLILSPFGYGRYRHRRHGFGSGLLMGGLMGGMMGGMMGGGFGGGGFGGGGLGGFAGGGGSFGGGGAMGGW